MKCEKCGYDLEEHDKICAKVLKRISIATFLSGAMLGFWICWKFIYWRFIK